MTFVMIFELSRHCVRRKFFDIRHMRRGRESKPVKNVRPNRDVGAHGVLGGTQIIDRENLAAFLFSRSSRIHYFILEFSLHG
jgi:hypothetical protein